MPSLDLEPLRARRRELRETALEQGLVPDTVLRASSLYGAWRRERHEGRGGAQAQSERLRELVAWMSTGPIADATPGPSGLMPELLPLVLGPRRQQSGCLWNRGASSLAAAEDAMLALSCTRAQTSDGMRILDFGSGWGALSLWLAEQYPAAHITAVATSQRQRAWIQAESRARGLGNVQVLTADINDWTPPRRFDRVMSIETLERARNWRELLGRMAGWLRANGKAFIQVRSHRTLPYRLEETSVRLSPAGLMPSHDLLPRFQEHLNLVADWIVPGTHYARTLGAWLDNLDAHTAEAMTALQAEGQTRAEARRGLARWRESLLSGRELWGYRGGNRWLVSHYLLEPRGIHSQPL